MRKQGAGKEKRPRQNPMDNSRARAGFRKVSQGAQEKSAMRAREQRFKQASKISLPEKPPQISKNPKPGNAKQDENQTERHGGNILGKGSRSFAQAV